MRKLLLIPALALLGACGGETGGAADVTDPEQPSQEWDLVSQVGDISTVRVPPGTFTSTFNEIAGGWFVYIPGCAPIKLLNLGGTVSRTEWRFITVSGNGCGTNVLMNGTGVAGVAFPEGPIGTVVQGTVQITTQGPLGSTSGTGTWQAIRTK